MAKLIRLNHQHPLLVLPRQLGPVVRDMSIRTSPGLTPFWPWCYVCEKKVPVCEKVDEGSGTVTYKAECHGDEMAIEIFSSAGGQFQHSRLDKLVKFLVFFAPEAAYGGEHSKWQDYVEQAKERNLTASAKPKVSERETFKKMIEGYMSGETQLAEKRRLDKYRK